MSTIAFSDSALRRAKMAIQKRGGFEPREPMFLRLAVVRQLVVAAHESNDIADYVLSMLYLVSYIFLLRVPSEAIPIAHGCIGLLGNGEKAVLYMEGDTLYLKLARRKNKAKGSLMKRSCWCKTCPDTCPVHVLWSFFESFDFGTKPFMAAGVTPHKAICSLRRSLKGLRVPDHSKYRLHDFRRGHAKDLQMSGANLAEILQAGEWKSPAFMAYLDIHELEAGSVVEAHMENSSSEEE